jgi:hypothetical protein
VPSQDKDIQFLQAYLERKLKNRKFVLETPRSNFMTPKKILSQVPSERKANKKLVKHAERFLSMAKKCESPARATRLKRRSKRLNDPDYRSKLAARIVAREKWRAKLRAKQLTESIAAANSEDERAARLADKHGFDGSWFRDYLFLDDDSTTLEILKRMGRQIETIPRLIEAIDKSAGSKVEHGKAGSAIQATPETDPGLIYLSAAAELYNIPKSTLSKAARRKPGELGYLWSVPKGRRVILRRTDCVRLGRSRTKLGR